LTPLLPLLALAAAGSVALLALAYTTPAALASFVEAGTEDGTGKGEDETATAAAAAAAVGASAAQHLPSHSAAHAEEAVEALERARWQGAMCSLFLVDTPALAVLTAALVGFSRTMSSAAAMLAAAAVVCAGIAAAVDVACVLYARLTLGTLVRGRDLMSVQLLLEASEEDEGRVREGRGMRPVNAASLAKLGRAQHGDQYDMER
jgi:hypothetical protein